MSKRRFPLKKFPELLKNPPPDVDIMLYDKKKEGVTSTGDHTVKKPRIDRLEERADQLEDRFDRLEDRFDRLEESIANLANEMRAGFKQVNSRIDNIDARLDYIVKANNLKDNK